MSVATSTSRISYVGNNSTSTAYVVDFPFALDGDLVVVKTLKSTGEETMLSLTTDYSVTGAGAPAGGSIVTVEAIPATYTVTIFREVSLIQPLEYEEADAFPAASHEEALDRLTYMSQQNARSVVGSFRVRESDGDIEPFMLIPNAFVGTDAGGNATMLDGSDIQAVLNLPATVIDQPTKTFADDAARGDAVPDFVGQVGAQVDSRGVYVATSLAAGGWTQSGIADASVTTSKIVDASITAGKLAGTLDLSSKIVTLPATVISGATAITETADGDFFWIWDATDSALKKVSKASLAGAFTPAGSVVQTVYAENATRSEITGVIPADASIPQLSSDGGVVMTGVITPLSATNKILVRVSGMISSVATYIAGAIFRNTTENAIYACAIVTGSSYPSLMGMEILDSPASATATTYTIKIGVQTSGTCFINGSTGASSFGGVEKWTLVLQEIKA